MIRYFFLFILGLSLIACSGVPSSSFSRSMFIRSNDVGLTEAQSCAIGYDLSKQVYELIKIRETVLIPVKRVKNSCEKYMMNFRLPEGGLIIMDNYRLLHGRTSFNTSEGSRFLQGLYIDHDSIESKYKILKKNIYG